MSDNKALTTTQASKNALMVFDTEGARHLYKLAQTMSESNLVPAHFKGKPADCFLAVEMAQRLQVAPFMVLQNLYIVHGKPGWSSQFLIAMANRSGTFKGVIRFEEYGSGDELTVTAYANLADTGERVESTVGMDMAKAEGWTSNPKYKSMPVQMLRYRSATFLVRTYCPEVTMGIQTSDEIETIPEDEITVSPVIDVADQGEAAADQLRVARAAAKDAGVPDEMLSDDMTSSEVYEMTKAFKEEEQEAVPEETPEEAEKKTNPADKKPREDHEVADAVVSKAKKTKAEEKKTKLSTLEKLADKMDQGKLADTVGAELKKMSAVERAAYGKLIKMTLKADTDLNVVDFSLLKRLYVAIEAEKQEADKSGELSFA